MFNVDTYEILVQCLAPEEITFLEQIAYGTKEYFKATKIILIHQGQYKELKKRTDDYNNIMSFPGSFIIVDYDKSYNETVQLKKNEIEEKIKILCKYYEIHKNEYLLNAKEVVDIFDIVKNWDSTSQNIIHDILKNSYEKYIEKEKNTKFADLLINFKRYSKTLLEAQKNNINHKHFFEDLVELTVEKYFDALFHPELKKYNMRNEIQSYFQDTKHNTESISKKVSNKIVEFYNNDIVQLCQILEEISRSKEESMNLLIQTLSQICYQKKNFFYL